MWEQGGVRVLFLVTQGYLLLVTCALVVLPVNHTLQVLTHSAQRKDHPGHPFSLALCTSFPLARFPIIPSHPLE